MGSLEALRKHLEIVFPRLVGAWVKKRSNYEQDFCNIIQAECAGRHARYKDADWQGINLEIKKGNLWLNLIRYGEYVLAEPAEASAPSITLILYPLQTSDRIGEIYALDTSALVKLLGITEEDARYLVCLRQRLRRDINCQAKLRKTEVIAHARFKIRGDPSIGDARIPTECDSGSR